MFVYMFVICTEKDIIIKNPVLKKHIQMRNHNLHVHMATEIFTTITTIRSHTYIHLQEAKRKCDKHNEEEKVWAKSARARNTMGPSIIIENNTQSECLCTYWKRAFY